MYEACLPSPHASVRHARLHPAETSTHSHHHTHTHLTGSEKHQELSYLIGPVKEARYRNTRAGIAAFGLFVCLFACLPCTLQTQLNHMQSSRPHTGSMLCGNARTLLGLEEQEKAAVRA